MACMYYVVNSGTVCLIIRNGLAADEHLRIVYGHTNAIVCSALKLTLVVIHGESSMQVKDLYCGPLYSQCKFCIIYFINF